MTVFRFGEFTFDCGSRMLFQQDVERHLSPKAHQLLRALLLARPRAMSREDLYDELWPSTFVSETNLASIVNEVRRALGDDPRVPQYVRTVHAFGYAFCGEVTAAAPQGPAAVWSSPVAAVLTWGKQQYLLSEGENSVGRESDNEVVLLDPTVSRRHAVVMVFDGVISIRDLDSKNGTHVDGIRTGPSPVTIRNGAQIEFGAVLVQIASRKISSTQSLQLNMPALKRMIAART